MMVWIKIPSSICCQKFTTQWLFLKHVWRRYTLFDFETIFFLAFWHTPTKRNSRGVVCFRRGMLGRWPAEQEAAHHHHRQAAGDLEDGVQQQSEARASRTGTAEPGHRTGHAGRPGLVPEQVSPRKKLPNDRQIRS